MLPTAFINDLKTRIFYRARDFRGGIGRYNRVVHELTTLRPNSSNWQKNSKNILVSLDDLPNLYYRLFELDLESEVTGGGGGIKRVPKFESSSNKAESLSNLDIDREFPNTTSDNFSQVTDWYFKNNPRVINEISSELASCSSVSDARYNYSINSQGEVLSYNGKSGKRLSELFVEFNAGKRNHSLLYGGLLDELHDVIGEFTLLEIGIGSKNPNIVSNMSIANSEPGGSLRAFNSFSSDINVVGADIDSEVLFNDRHIKTYQANQMDPKSLQELTNLLPRDLAFVVDDGYHFLPANINTILEFFDAIVPGGYIIIEDITPRKMDSYLLVSKILDYVGLINYFWQDDGNNYELVIKKQKLTNKKIY